MRYRDVGRPGDMGQIAGERREPCNCYGCQQRRSKFKRKRSAATLRMLLLGRGIARLRGQPKGA